MTIIGFVGADSEQRQARNNNGSKFTVLSVATQRSWKNTNDEWSAYSTALSRRFLRLEEFLKGEASKSEQAPAQAPKAETAKQESKREAPSLLRKLFS